MTRTPTRVAFAYHICCRRPATHYARPMRAELHLAVAVLVGVTLGVGCVDGRSLAANGAGGAGGVGGLSPGAKGGAPAATGNASDAGLGGRTPGTGGVVAMPTCAVMAGAECDQIGAYDSCCTALCPPWPDGAGGGQSYVESFECLLYGGDMKWFSCGIGQSTIAPCIRSTDDVCTMGKPHDESVACPCQPNPCRPTERYWPNTTRGRCEPYPTCGGGAALPNSFATREACEAMCGAVLDADAGAE